MIGERAHLASASALDATVLADASAVRTFAQAWGFALSPELEDRATILESRGFRFLALVYAGDLRGAVTRTVRITDDAFPSVPLFMTLGVDVPVRVTAFLLGDQRARLGAGVELQLRPATSRRDLMARPTTKNDARKC